MIRETRLSPRRAPKLSRLPLSPRQTQVRLKPLLFLRPHPPKGGTPRSETPRFGPHSDHPSFDARLRSSGLRRVSSWSHGAARSARVPSCGLNSLRPGFAGSPLFKSSDPSRAKPSRLLHPGPFCAVSTGKLSFPVLKEKLPCKPIFLSKPESFDSWRETPAGQPKR